jgi:hypothetical protein
MGDIEEFVNTHPLPKEDLPPFEYPEGKRGGDYGWPHGIMTKPMVQILRSEGITKTSQLFVLARSVSLERFRKFVEGQEDKAGTMGNPRGLHVVVHLWLARGPTRVEFESRIPARTPADAIDHSCLWTGADYTFMIGLLRTVRDWPVNEHTEDRATEHAQKYIDRFNSIYPVWRAMHSRALR